VTKRLGTLLLLLPAVLAAACGPAGQAAGSAPQRLAAKAGVPFEQLRPSLKAPHNAPEATTVPAETAETLRQARDLMDANQPRQALEALGKVLAGENPPAEAHRLAGLCHRALGEHDSARAALAKADEAAPDNLLLQKTLADYAIRRGQAHEALRRLRLALLCSDAKEDAPETAETILRLAALLEQQGYLVAAATCYQRLGALAVTHGRAYASSRLLAGLAEQPERCDLAAGKLLLKAGKDPQAAVLLERAYRYDKTHRDTGLLAVKALVAVGDLARAEEIVMEMAHEPSLRSLAASAAVVLCRARKDPAVPLRMLDGFLKARGTNSIFAVALASQAARYGKAEEATRLLGRYRDGEEDDRAVAFRLAELHARSGRHTAAAEEFASILDDDAVGAEAIWEELSRPGGGGWTGEAIRPIVTAAEGAEGKRKPALLCIAAMLAEAVEGDTVRAGRLLERAIEADGKYWPAQEALYDMHLRADDEDAAAAVLKKLEGVPATEYFPHYLQGRELLRNDKPDQAVRALEAARERAARNVPVLIRLGYAYGRMLRVATGENRRTYARQAEERLLAACALAPGRLVAAQMLYDLYMASGRSEDAGAVMDRFVSDNPGHAEGRVLQARYHIQGHDSDRAHELLGDLLEEAPGCVDASLLQVQLEAPELLSDVPVPADPATAIIRRLQKIVAGAPGSDPAGRLYAAMLVNQDRPADAARVLADLHARKPHDVAVVNALLTTLSKAGKLDQARAAANSLVARTDLTGPMEEAVIDRLLEMPDPAQAVAAAETFLDRPGDAGRTILRRLRALRTWEQAKRYDRALAKLDEWLAAPGGDDEFAPVLRRSRIRFLALAGKTDEAAAAAVQWLDQDKGDIKLKIDLMRTLLAAKAYKPALELLDELIAATPPNDRILSTFWRLRMLSLVEAERVDELFQTEARWIAQNPDHPQRVTREMLAIGALAAAKRYDDALRIAGDRLNRLRKSDPAGEKDWAEQVHDARATVISLLLRADRTDEAVRRAQQFVTDDPKDARARKLLAGVLSSAEKDGEYLRQLEQAYELDPEDTGINNDLGYSWVDRGMNLPKAEAMVRKALLARPREIAFQDSLAWALYKTARFGEAKRIFDTIVGAPPEDLHAVILDHAGDTCWRLGMDLEAIRMWVRALVVAGAEEEKDRDKESRAVLEKTPGKIAACRRGGPPRLAPVAAGYGDPAGVGD